MSLEPYPDWMKIAFEERFIELARLAGKQEEIKSLHQQQSKLEDQMKNELTMTEFQNILECGEISNHRNTSEKEWLYFEGLKDGMKLLKQLNDFLLD